MNPDPAVRDAPDLNLLEQMYKTAEIMGVEDEYMVFRRFSRLNVFNLLLLQRELKHLEKDIEARLKDNDDDDIKTLSRDLRSTLREYSELSNCVITKESC
jgi:hypothetical protein